MTQQVMIEVNLNASTRSTKQTSRRKVSRCQGNGQPGGWGVGGGVGAGSSDILRALEKIENKKPTFRKTPLILMEALSIK